MPAETRVAECIRADAGTGASIESGSQKCNPNWADLQQDATISKKRNSEAYERLMWPKKILVEVR